MATLNIKNFPDTLYEALQTRAGRERRSVAQEVTHLLSLVLEDAEPVSVLDLQGLGKELWRDVEAGAHVDRERASWD